MKEYEAHFNEVDENPLGFAIGFRNACILVIPIWTVVLDREQDIRNREGDEMKCQKSTSVK